MDYKSYKSDASGAFGYGVNGGHGIEFSLFNNRVDGAFIQKSTTGSSQLTGAGNGTFLYDITPGFAIVGKEVLEIAGAVDQACEAAGNIIANGQSKIYMFVAYKTEDGTVVRKTVESAVAVTASVVPPTPAEITAALPLGVPWVCLGSMQINRTGDTTVTEAVDNQYRPMLVPKTVHG